MKPLAVVLLACATAVPGDGRWSPAAPLPEPIQELSAAALHGKIYVAGGIDRSNHPTAAASPPRRLGIGAFVVQRSVAGS